MLKETPSTVKLHTYALSPFGVKVYWTLVYKRIDFELIYVSAKDQRQISFSGQKTVPVTTIDGDWMQDSRDTCIWLDEVFGGRMVSGSNSKERQDIIEADAWVNENIIALFFRQAIDKEESRNARKIGRKLSAVLRSTGGEVPWITRFFWPTLLRQADFVRHAASQVDPNLSCTEHRSRVIEELDEKLAPTGFIAATSEPSFADLSAYGQIMTSTTLKLPGELPVERSKNVVPWLREVEARLPSQPVPSLVPDWSLKRWA